MNTGKSIKQWLKGSTIMEVLIALAITSFCSVFAVIIYLNLQKSSVPFFKLKAMELAQFCLNETLKQRTFYEETKPAEEFTVRKFVNPHEIFNDCKVIRIVVFDNSKKKLVELETTVYTHE